MSKKSLKEQVARAIMEQFWGELPKGYDWKEESHSLTVRVTDDPEVKGETVLEMAERIMKLIGKD